MTALTVKENDHGLDAPWSRDDEKRCLATNRRTTAIESTDAGERLGDVEPGHEHWACASFREICHF